MANSGPSKMREMLIADLNGFKFEYLESHIERDLFLFNNAKICSTKPQLTNML